MAEASRALAAHDWVVPRRTLVPALDMLLPGETIAVRTEARAFGDKVLAPLAHDLNTVPERRDGFRHDVFRAIAEAGLYAVPFATDVGGRGLSHPTLATMTVLEEIAYDSPGVASAMYDAQILLAAKVIDAAGGA